MGRNLSHSGRGHTAVSGGREDCLRGAVRLTKGSPIAGDPRCPIAVYFGRYSRTLRALLHQMPLSGRKYLHLPKKGFFFCREKSRSAA